MTRAATPEDFDAVLALFTRCAVEADETPLTRNILEFCGISPVRATLVGTVDSAAARQRALARMQGLGRGGR